MACGHNELPRPPRCGEGACIIRAVAVFAGLVSSDWAAHGGVSWPRLETTTSTVCPLIIPVLLGVLDEHTGCVNHRTMCRTLFDMSLGDPNVA